MQLRLVRAAPLLARSQLVEETLAQIRLFSRSLQWAAAAAGQTFSDRHAATDCLVAVAVVAPASEVPARSGKEMSVARARGWAAGAAVDRQVLAVQITIREEMAATARRVQSQAKASYMRPEEEALVLAMRAREGHLELAAGEVSGAAQRQLLGPRTPAAVVAVRMSMRTETSSMRLAQEPVALW
jgi:hypothetical protein